MIDLFLEICGSAAFARAHGPRNDTCLFEMSLSICTQGQALVRSRKKNPFLFSEEGSVIMRACATLLSWLLGFWCYHAPS